MQRLLIKLSRYFVVRMQIYKDLVQLVQTGTGINICFKAYASRSSVTWLRW
jgi:hypothetical protein